MTSENGSCVKKAFTLTYAEFLEAHRTQGQGSGHFVVPVCAVIYIAAGIGCLVFGIWTGIQSRSDVNEGSVARCLGLSAAGLLLIMGIPQVWQWYRRTSQHSADKRLKESFLQKWDGPMQFEADGQGWTCRSENQQGLHHPWHTLRGLWDHETVVTIASENEICFLPKRVFEEAELAELTGLVSLIFQRGEAESVFTAELRASAWDYMLGEASIQRNFYTPWGLVLLGFAIAACIWLLVYLVLYRIGDDQSWGSLFIPGAPLLLMLWFLLAPLMTLQRHRRSAEVEPSIRANITSDGIFLQTQKAFCLMRFDRMHKYKETRHVLLFFYTGGYCQMLPKRGLEPKQLQTLQQLIAVKLS